MMQSVGLEKELYGRRTRTRVLLTAHEAYPALEEAFLDAQRCVQGSFLVFDLATRLRSARALSVGKTWFDLVIHTLARGVEITLTISDFDPLARAASHRATWFSVRRFQAAAAMVKGAKLHVCAMRHPAQTGILPRLCLWPLILHKQLRAARWLNHLAPDQRAAALRDMPGLRVSLMQGATGRMRPCFWPVPYLNPGTHHQKMAIFDDRLLYIGGLDLAERHYDSPEHDRPGSETWHDVQLMIEGPVVAEAKAHLDGFLDVVAGGADPMPTRRLLRTMSRRRRVDTVYFGPEPVVQEIATAHEALIRHAQRLIYLETQYFRDRRLAQSLARAAQDNPALTMILILPAAPDDIAFEGKTGLDARYGEFLQARALRLLSRAFGRRLFIGGAAQPRRSAGTGRDTLNGAPIIYVHAKVSIFDDSGAIVSSANLNGRSLRWDTEAGVYLNIPRDLAELRRKVMAHWLPADAGEEYFSIETAAESWRKRALSNAHRPPEDRRGFLLPYDIAAAEAFGRGLPAIPEEMV